MFVKNKIVMTPMELHDDTTSLKRENQLELDLDLTILPFSERDNMPPIHIVPLSSGIIM